MGRFLSYGFTKLTKKEIKKQHMENPNNHYFKCDYDCECEYGDYEAGSGDGDSLFSQTHANLPAFRIYTFEKMQKECLDFLQEKKFYEVSVLAYILSEWPDKYLCIFNYI
jgi:hypothetical protein